MNASSGALSGTKPRYPARTAVRTPSRYVRAACMVTECMEYPARNGSKAICLNLLAVWMRRPKCARLASCLSWPRRVRRSAHRSYRSRGWPQRRVAAGGTSYASPSVVMKEENEESNNRGREGRGHRAHVHVLPFSSGWPMINVVVPCAGRGETCITGS